MDGFTGYETAAQEVLPQAQAVMDPLHVVRLAGDKATDIRCRLQIEQHAHRGRKGDLLYKAKKILLTGQENHTHIGRESF